MIILKKVQNIIKILAGEIINIESGNNYYNNGVYNNFAEKCVKISTNNIVDIITPVCGYIYIDLNIWVTEFIDKLFCCIYDMENEVFEKTNRKILQDYHTIESGFHTNIKIKSTKTAIAIETLFIIDKTSIYKRYFATHTNKSAARFTWQIKPLSHFDFDEIQQDKYESSIMYDCNDILNLPHNSKTDFLQPKDFICYKNIINESVDIYIPQPYLLFELNKHHRDFCKKHGMPLCEINKPIYSLSYENMPLIREDTVLFENKKHYLCNKCKYILYGDNYLLVNNVFTSDNILLCPLCMHADTNYIYYLTIYRVTFPLTETDIINNLNLTEQKKDILFEVLKSVVSKPHNCFLIGSKYAVFYCLQDYLYMTPTPDYLQNRKILIC